MAVNNAESNILVVRVTGNSMRPFIRNGDYALIKRCALSELFIGNIVAMMLQDKEGKNSKLCIHRLLWKNPTSQIVIKGDSLSSLGRIRIGKDGEFIGKIISIVRDHKVIPVEKHWNNMLKLFISLCLIPWQIIRRH